MPRILRHHMYDQSLLILSLLLVWSYVVPAFAAGCGTVQLGGNATSFDVGIAPKSMVTGDFNHDGKNDLAVANYGSGQGATDGSVSVLLNDGSGGFSSATNVPVGINPKSIVSADFNKDGNPDLAVLNYAVGGCCIDSFVTILLGNGSGNFTAAGSPLAVGNDSAALTTGDFNKDGNVDLAATVLVSPSRSVSILLGNGNAGFSAATKYPAGGATSIVTGDFNGDTKPDLVTSNLNGSNISVLLGDGLGAFGAPVNYNVGGANPQFIAVGDFNQDSKLDVVTANTFNSVSVLLGNGDGTFGAATPFTVASSPQSVLVQDINGDGKLDIVTANSGSSTVSVLVGDGQGSFGSQASYTPGLGSFFVVSSDFNGDGKSDLAVANAASNNVVVLAGIGSGAFAGARTFNVGLTPLAVAGGDLNGDGKIDLVVTNGSQNSISVLLGMGNGSFGPDVKFPTVFDPRDVILADFNGDGKLDAAVADGVCCNIKQSVAILLGNGNGGFGAATSFDAGTNAVAIVSADFNKDGNADLAVANNADSNFSVLLGDGNGSFATPTNISLPVSPNDIATGDLNGDGNADLIVGPLPVSVFLGNGMGGFSAGPTIPLPDVVSVAIGDVNGDGLADLATANNAGSLSILLGDGSGGFGAAASFPVASPSSVALADMNGDGKTDLTASSGSGNIVVLLGDGAGAFGSATSFNAGIDPRGILPIDLNADGRLDLAIANRGGYLSVLLNTCAATPAVPPRLSISDVTLAEGNSGQSNASFAVSLSAVSDQTVTVSYFSSGKSATAGLDFQSVSGHLTFLPGVTTQTITVPVNGDVTVEPDEDFYVFLSNPLNAAIEKGKATGRILNDDGPATLAFSAPGYTVSEGGVGIDVTLLRSGNLAGASTVDYSTADASGINNCNAIHGTASSRCDYETTIGTLHFAAGETSKTITIPIVDDTYAEGNENFTINLSNPSGAVLDTPSSATITINDNETVNGANPIDQANFFVRQHYIDFLNREPDAAGLAFWSNQITECQQPGATCNAALRRINVSAAFFLSIEFQETGYLVERIYKAAYGDFDGTSVIGGSSHLIKVPIVKLNEFLADSQQIAKDVAVGVGNWQAQLESNKVAFTQDFVTRPRFVSAYPTTMTPADFVDKLFLNAVVTPSASERNSIIGEFGGAGNTADTAARARALRRVAENTTLAQQERNKAFVLMQYFGYLRRNPNDPQDTDHTGYDFWLRKLNQFNGNFESAEMVKAFIDSIEYRTRFAP